jgi:hypothetical protein
MNRKGTIFDWTGTATRHATTGGEVSDGRSPFCALVPPEGGEYEITDAVIADRRISVDWIEGGEAAHLEAKSKDGIHFRGNFGYTKADPACSFELRRFTSAQDVLLLGSWINMRGEEGGWLFLIPGAANAGVRKKPRSRRARKETQS